MYESIYQHLPVFFQNLACNVHGFQQRRLRYGGDFAEKLAWLEKSQWWTPEQIEDYQTKQLQKLINHAYNTVPFYRRVFDKHGLKPSDIKVKDDLNKIPILTKEDVRNNVHDLISRNFSKHKLVHSHTSGTSGKSLQFYMEPSAFKFRWALWWRHRKRFGIEFDSPYATFTGLNAIPLKQTTPPFWRENYLMHQTVFTMHHIVPEKVYEIVKRLNKGGYIYYSGYPSVISVLAHLIQEKGLKITAPPKIIFTGAENLYDHQRRLISEVFQCPVTDQYGFSEGCGNASRCEKDVFHEDFEYGILECEEPLSHNDGSVQGRIIATGFASYAMPFIRYDVGDMGTWVREKCSCGRCSASLLKINGRVEDYVITPEGGHIMRFDYIFKDSLNIKEAQVVQYKPGAICIRIVRRSGYCQEDEKYIRQEIQNKISPSLAVEFDYVNTIEREPNSKFRAVKSFLKDSEKNL
jgi:phenylacetate-CoA ligase